MEGTPKKPRRKSKGAFAQNIIPENLADTLSVPQINITMAVQSVAEMLYQTLLQRAFTGKSSGEQVLRTSNPNDFPDKLYSVVCERSVHTIATMAPRRVKLWLVTGRGAEGCATSQLLSLPEVLFCWENLLTLADPSPYVHYMCKV